MGSYSIDVLKKLAFTKEIEHIKHDNSEDEFKKIILVTYMEQRIKEIDKEYGDEPIRD
jgi:hypothetical protein